MHDEEFRLKDAGSWGAPREGAWRAFRSYVEACSRLGLAARIELDRYGTVAVRTEVPVP